MKVVTYKQGEKIDKRIETVICSELGSGSMTSQTITGLDQGSYTLNVWLKGTGTGNASYIKAADCGGPDATSMIDAYINDTAYTQITLRNVLVYNGQCTVRIYSGENCHLFIGDVELIEDSSDENPILNWNFENGLQKWQRSGDVSISEAADTGKNAVRLGPDSEICQTILVKPNTRYIATVRAKVDAQDVWEQTQAYDNQNRRAGHNLTRKQIGDRVNLGVRRVDQSVIRQAPAGNADYCLLTISFQTGEHDRKVTIYANTIYDENYETSVSLHGKKADPDLWKKNSGNAYVDNFDLFEKDDSIVMGADVSYLGIIEDLGGRYFANGVQQDCLRILSNHGVNAINGMVFVHEGEPSIIPGTNKVKRVLPKGFGKEYWYNLAERAKELDMKYMVNFMLSDTWMNAIQAYPPKDWMIYDKENDVWNNQPLEEMTVTLYHYVYDFLNGLVKKNIVPIAVKIGNEEDGGILWDTGKDIKSEGFQKLINAAYDAAHDAIPAVPAFLHTYKGYDPKGAQGFFETLRGNQVKYDGHAYSIYGNRDIYQILNVLNQDVTQDPYADTLYVETGYTVTTYNPDWSDAMANGVQKNIATPAYWEISPNGQYNYLLDFAQAFRDIPNPHSVMRGYFYWAAEWYAIAGAGEETTLGNNCDRQNLYNNGDRSIRDMGSVADGKQGDMLEGMYAYLWRGKSKNRRVEAKNPMKDFKRDHYVVKNGSVQEIRFDEETVVIQKGQSRRLPITILPEDGFYNWNVNWTSDNEAVAVVETNGFLTGVAVGTTMITVTTEENKCAATRNVTVIEAVQDSTCVSSSGADTSLRRSEITTSVKAHSEIITEFVYDGGNQHVSIISEKEIEAVVVHVQYNEDGTLKGRNRIDVTLAEGENKVDLLAMSGDQIMLLSKKEGKPLAETLQL